MYLYRENEKSRKLNGKLKKSAIESEKKAKKERISLQCTLDLAANHGQHEITPSSLHCRLITNRINHSRHTYFIGEVNFCVRSK